MLFSAREFVPLQMRGFFLVEAALVMILLWIIFWDKMEQIGTHMQLEGKE